MYTPDNFRRTSIYPTDTEKIAEPKIIIGRNSSYRSTASKASKENLFDLLRVKAAVHTAEGTKSRAT